MGKVKYLLKRITHMSFSNMFKTINKVHEKNGKWKVKIFFDVIYCGLKYQAGYVDYYQFEMYKMNKKERKTIITRGINNAICKKYNDPSEIYKFEDKCIFNDLFKDYMKRDYLQLTDSNFDEFKKFIKKHKVMIVKPVGLSCGKGVEKINTTEFDAKELYEQLLSNKQILLEEVATQCTELDKLYPHSINTLRVVTLNKKVVTAYLRIGNHGNVVDNFNHGGMVTAIDINDGIIKFKAIDKETNVYEIHPMTKEKIVGLKLPNWDKVKKLCEDACEIVPKVGYIAWDVCLGDEPTLIEGNDFPGHDLYQLPVHREGNIGLLPVFESVMKGDK